MLNRVLLKSFKGIQEANIEFRPITIFIGVNGSGKSSIAQALMMLTLDINNNQDYQE